MWVCVWVCVCVCVSENTDTFLMTETQNFPECPGPFWTIGHQTAVSISVPVLSILLPQTPG